MLTQLREVKARCDEEREQMLIQKEEDMLMSFGMQSLIESSTPQIPKCDHGGLRPELNLSTLELLPFPFVQ